MMDIALGKERNVFRIGCQRLEWCLKVRCEEREREKRKKYKKESAPAQKAKRTSAQKYAGLCRATVVANPFPSPFPFPFHLSLFTFSFGEPRRFFTLPWQIGSPISSFFLSFVFPFPPSIFVPCFQSSHCDLICTLVFIRAKR